MIICKFKNISIFMSLVLDALNKFEDPRDPEKVVYPLPSILFMSICAIFCGAEGWEDIVLWADAHKDWLKKNIDMRYGVPSYSTIRRTFMIVLPTCWGKLMKDVVLSSGKEQQAEDQVPIDGKSLCASKCDAKGIRAIQMVSAWSVENEIILGEVKTESKSNEITAIPLLLELLDLEGATVSIDAMGCNEKIISKILEQGAHYLIGLKKNQPKLHDAVEKYALKQGMSEENLVSDSFDESHGRCVRRRYFAFDIPDHIKQLGFTKMNTVVATETISSSKYSTGVKSEIRYYLTDHDKSNVNLPRYVRGHWGVESMHWCLDVHLNDDGDKKYEKNAAENFAKTKRFLFNLVKSKPPKGKKRSLRLNLKLVGWDMDYLTRLLFS